MAAGCALSWGADWLTDGGNVQRTAWQKDEKILSTANVKDMKLLWKIKLDNEAAADARAVPAADRRAASTLPAGPKQIVIEAGVSDNIFAIDAETGRTHLEEALRRAPGLRRQLAAAAAAFSVPAASPRRP